MLTATALALGAAVLHAGWNLAVKQATGDRFLMLWGQFTIAALFCAPIVFLFGGLPARSWVWIVISGSVHLPYCIFLAKAYDTGDFSFVYPIARGGGAMLAAIGGVALLSDSLRPMTAFGIATVGSGLFLLAGFRRSTALRNAVIVALTIGAYSLSDAKGIRTSGTLRYAFAAHLGTGVTTTAYGLVRGRASEMRATMAANYRRLTLAALASTLTYFMVQVAFRSAPVGYVTALRESSVVLAALIGWKTLGETGGKRRLAATLVVATGLIVMVVSR